MKYQLTIRFDSKTGAIQVEGLPKDAKHLPAIGWMRDCLNVLVDDLTLSQFKQPEQKRVVRVENPIIPIRRNGQ